MKNVSSYIRKNYVEAVVRMLLQEFNIIKPPVDVEKLAKQCGVHLIYHEYDKPSFVVLCRGYYMMFIHLSNYGRNRWSIAHELAHVKLGHMKHVKKVEALCEGRPIDRQGFIMEKEADLFARNLLMPSMWVKRFISETPRENIVGKMMEEFGVSRQAAQIRLSEVGMPINHSQ